MTTETRLQRPTWSGFEYIDARMFLHRHRKSRIAKTKVCGDSIGSVIAEVRKEICGIKEFSEFMLTVIVRDGNSLYMKDIVNLLDAITGNRQGINCLWGVAEDPNADVNFRISVYTAQ